MIFFDFTNYFSGKTRLLRSKATVLAVFLVFLAAGSGEAVGKEPAALGYTGIHSLREDEPNLNGQDVVIAAVCRSLTYIGGQPQNDYRMNTGHNCFSASDVNFVDDIGDDGQISDHSTAIGAILVGADPNGYHPEIGKFSYEGALPRADVDVYEFWHFITDYVFENKQFEADVLTMSIGSAMEDWWTRGIERMAERDGLIVVAGAGNGGNVCDPLLYPAAGTNAIGVGVIDPVNIEGLSGRLDNFSLPRPEHSSSGPTSDGRSKPDIVAPGNCLVPDPNNTDGYYESGSWSSFATPIVAGTAGLLVQKAHGEADLAEAVSKDGGNCVIKAIIMNSATKLAYWHKGNISEEDDHLVSLDHTQGAGAVNAEAAYKQLVAGQAGAGQVGQIGWDNSTVEKNNSAGYNIKISEPAEKLVTATLVWNRHYEDKYPFAAVKENSDLRLELWATDPNEPDTSYLIDHSDSINDNVEHLYAPVDANFNRFEIVVKFSERDNSKADTSERYALAWSVSELEDDDSIWWYDINGDGETDDADFKALLNKLGKTNNDKADVIGDINMDGTIDIKDLAILNANIDTK